MYPDALPLAEALDSLREELLYAIDRASAADLRFAVDGIEVELQVVRATGAEASGSAGLWRVVTVGGKASYSSAATHRVKLQLRPRLAGGGEADEIQIGDATDQRPE